MTEAMLLCLALGIIFSFGPAVAADNDAAGGCRRLADEAAVTVVYRERAVTTDDTQDAGRLKALSGRGVHAYHHVLGLTRAVPEYRVSAAVRLVNDREGRFCALPRVSVTLGFSDLEVHLAREVADPCRREIIREHEEEHIGVWKQHLRVGARMLETQLRRELVLSHSYPSPAAAEADIRARIDALVASKMKVIAAGIEQAQREIDSPLSYAAVTGRLRACPAASPPPPR